MSSGSVTVVETAPIKECKYCLVGVPDVGLVGSIALGYVILEQQMVEVGYLESDAFPPIIVVHQGDPKHPLRLYSKGNIVAAISEMPIEARLIPLVAQTIVDWAKSKNAEILIALSGIAVQNRLEIDVPGIYGVGSSALMKKLMKDQGIEILEEGFITGLHAVVMKECLKKGVSNMILLAQSHLQYPDPGAAASLIASFDKMVGLKVDTKKLLDRADETRVRMRALMQRTQQQMRQTQKGHEQEIPAMYV
jgi:uncharacterized protein